MLSFGDPRPFADEIARAGALLIRQRQTLAHVREAIEAGADVVVAQSAEAGGHGMARGALSPPPAPPRGRPPPPAGARPGGALPPR